MNEFLMGLFGTEHVVKAWFLLGWFVPLTILAYLMCHRIYYHAKLYILEDGNLGEWPLEKIFSSYNYSGEVSMLLLILGVSSGGVLCILYNVPFIPLTIAIGYALLRLARASVRLKNKLSSHMADINAHKGE